jgi:hypothetical protein
MKIKRRTGAAGNITHHAHRLALVRLESQRQTGLIFVNILLGRRLGDR